MTARAEPLRETWPIHRRQAGQLICGYAVLTIVWIGFGKLLTGPFKDSAIVRADQRVAKWMVTQRTPTWNHLTVWGSYLAETTTKIIVTAVLALVLLMVWKRWFEPMVLVVSLVIEAAAFIVIDDDRGSSAPRRASVGQFPGWVELPAADTRPRQPHTLRSSWWCSGTRGDAGLGASRWSSPPSSR